MSPRDRNAGSPFPSKAPGPEEASSAPGDRAAPEPDRPPPLQAGMDEASSDAELSRRLRARRLREAAWRHVLFAAGLMFTAVGAIGMVVPMLPGTVFLILAAWCFTRSSPRFEAWLLNHRWLGPSVRRWRETGAIPLPVKLLALSSFVGTFSGSWYFGAPLPALIGMGVMFVALAVFIVTRPSG